MTLQVIDHNINEEIIRFQMNGLTSSFKTGLFLLFTKRFAIAIRAFDVTKGNKFFKMVQKMLMYD